MTLDGAKPMTNSLFQPPVRQRYTVRKIGFRQRRAVEVGSREHRHITAVVLSDSLNNCRQVQMIELESMVLEDCDE
jgi:hypothetical protein